MTTARWWSGVILFRPPLPLAQVRCWMILFLATGNGTREKHPWVANTESGVHRERRVSLRLRAIFPSSSSAASSSATASAPSHASASTVAPVLSSLMHVASPAAVCLVLSLLLLDDLDDLVWYSKVLYLRVGQSPPVIYNPTHSLYVRARISLVIS